METLARKPYPTDLTDAQWAILEPLVPPSKHGGRPRTVNIREVINTILYLNRTGCQWELLPHDLLPKSTVYEYFAQWRDDGTWAKFVDALRSQARTQAGRDPTPSAICIDSQSVKSTEVGGEDRSYDGGKKIKVHPAEAYLRRCKVRRGASTGASTLFQPAASKPCTTCVKPAIGTTGNSRTEERHRYSFCCTVLRCNRRLRTL